MSHRETRTSCGLVILLSAAAIATTAVAEPVVCVQGSLTRSIEVVYSQPGHPVPCEVLYDKSAEGTITTLWQANNEAGYCEAKAEQLVEKLEGMGWQCGPAEMLGDSVEED